MLIDCPNFARYYTIQSEKFCAEKGWKPTKCFVYFLYFDGKLVYIGKTRNYWRCRVREHANGNRIRFDQCYIIEFCAYCWHHWWTEEAFIFHLVPKLNDVIIRREFTHEQLQSMPINTMLTRCDINSLLDKASREKPLRKPYFRHKIRG